ncbi:MAG: hypothetical protein EDM05_55980 (plasmid) [Leptolyngbya sp. IPPAS B-1204]
MQASWCGQKPGEDIQAYETARLEQALPGHSGRNAGVKWAAAGTRSFWVRRTGVGFVWAGRYRRRDWLRRNCGTNSLFVSL